MEAGERLRVTVSGRAVAEMAQLLPETTDDETWWRAPTSRSRTPRWSSPASRAVPSPTPRPRVLRVALRDAGRRTPLDDSRIAATALSRGVPVVTQDADRDGVPGPAGIRV